MRKSQSSSGMGRLVTAWMVLTFAAGCVFAQPGATTALPGLSAPGGEVYLAAAGEKVFSDREFTWNRLPSAVTNRPAVRHALAGLEPLEVTFTGPGRVLALLWVWDFGFVDDGPAGASNVDGWQLVDARAAEVRGFPRPLGLYARAIPPGGAKLNLKAYFAQWVLVGFEPGRAAPATGDLPLALEIVGAKTAHNIVPLGAKAVVRADGAKSMDDSARVVVELFDRGKRLVRVTARAADIAGRGVGVNLPDRPGRCWLQVGRQGSRGHWRRGDQFGDANPDGSDHRRASGNRSPRRSRRRRDLLRYRPWPGYSVIDSLPAFERKISV